MDLPKPLYFECHVTVDPLHGDRLTLFVAICKDWNFRVAKLLMQKKEGGAGAVNKLDSFCTGKDKDYEALNGRMYHLLNDLRTAEIHVRRYKIEAALIDVRQPNNNPCPDL